MAGFLRAKRISNICHQNMAAACTVFMVASKPQQASLQSSKFISSNEILRNSVFFRIKSFPAFRISCALAEPQTLEKVQQVIANQLSVDVSTVTPDAKFADLGADSLDTVEIMMNLEESFKISIAEDGASNILTVGDAANMIQQLVSKQN